MNVGYDSWTTMMNRQMTNLCHLSSKCFRPKLTVILLTLFWFSYQCKCCLIWHSESSPDTLLQLHIAYFGVNRRVCLKSVHMHTWLRVCIGDTNKQKAPLVLQVSAKAVSESWRSLTTCCLFSLWCRWCWATLSSHQHATPRYWAWHETSPSGQQIWRGTLKL